MFTITYRQLMTTPLIPALQQIFRARGVFDGKTAYRIAKISQVVEKQWPIADKELAAIGEALAERDEEGNPKRNPENRQFVVPADKQEEYDKRIDELLNKTFEVHVHRPSLSQMQNYRFSGEEILALEPLIEGLTTEDAPMLSVVK